MTFDISVVDVIAITERADPWVENLAGINKAIPHVIFGGNRTANLIGAGGVGYHHFAGGANAVSWTTGTTSRLSAFPSDTMIKNIVFKLTTAPGAGQSYTFDLVNSPGAGGTVLGSVTISDSNTTGVITGEFYVYRTTLLQIKCTASATPATTAAVWAVDTYSTIPGRFNIMGAGQTTTTHPTHLSLSRGSGNFSETGAYKNLSPMNFLVWRLRAHLFNSLTTGEGIEIQLISRPVDPTGADTSPGQVLGSLILTSASFNNGQIDFTEPKLVKKNDILSIKVVVPDGYTAPATALLGWWGVVCEAEVPGQVANFASSSSLIGTTDGSIFFRQINNNNSIAGQSTAANNAKYNADRTVVLKNLTVHLNGSALGTNSWTVELGKFDSTLTTATYATSAVITGSTLLAESTDDITVDPLEYPIIRTTVTGASFPSGQTYEIGYIQESLDNIFSDYSQIIESVQTEVSTDEPNSFEAVAISEDLTVELFYSVNTADTISVTESTATDITRLIDVAETLTATESTAAMVQTLISVFDQVNINETVDLGDPVSSDVITISEHIQIAFGDFNVSVFDTASISESLATGGLFNTTTVQLPQNRAKGFRRVVNMKRGGSI